MNDNAALVWFFAITCVVVLLCADDPDIIDGINKRLNDVPCEVESKVQE